MQFIDWQTLFIKIPSSKTVPWWGRPFVPNVFGDVFLRLKKKQIRDLQILFFMKIFGFFMISGWNCTSIHQTAWRKFFDGFPAGNWVMDLTLGFMGWVRWNTNLLLDIRNGKPKKSPALEGKTLCRSNLSNHLFLSWWLFKTHSEVSQESRWKSWRSYHFLLR